MIVFSCLKKEFVQYVDKHIISNKVYQAYKNTFNKKTKLSQIKSWANSLPYLKDIMEILPDNTGITIEYGIPLTSKRVDVIISGYNITKEPVVVLLEFKQWEYVEIVKNEDAMVRTKIGKSFKNVLHPSYQVLSYANLINNYNLAVEKQDIQVIPLVYLHNYELKVDGPILYKKYRPYYSKAPIFGKNDKDELKYILENNICYGDNLKVINSLDNSEIKPTRKLTNVIHNMIKAKSEFTLLDEQKLIMEEIIKLALEAYKLNQKTVMIIEGGPGTGKSILAINALGELLSLGLVGSYVSKNMAPREVYKLMLENESQDTNINELFKGSGRFFLDEANKYDFLLVDEAHRLQEKSGLRGNIGENQIKEIINAGKFSVFFIDEKQIITLKDIGNTLNIKKFAKEAGAQIYEAELKSQFRCNGSDGYLDFVDKILYNKKRRVKFNFDFRVMNDPVSLRELIKLKNTNNNARLVAGFCWTRDGKNADNQDYHDIKIGDLEMSWNLKHGEPFAIRENAIDEIGCVHNVQGLEFDYIGVIIGPDLKYERGMVVSDYKERANTEKSLYGLQGLLKKDKDTYEALADTIIKNTYRVLLTRGIKGCYVYAVDEQLQEYLKKLIF